jgi:3-hydroxybutyryl-CoA dehydrogenase
VFVTIASIGVIGSGQMGAGIAQVSACSGIPVVMVDVQQDFLDKGLATIRGSMDRLVSKDRMTAEQAEQSDCDLVIEAIPEIPELKFTTFSELDSLCKEEAILASNTSSISIDEIAGHTGRPDKVIGMHFMNPVPIMRLVEIINGSETSKAVTAKVVSLAERLGKTPLTCMDSPGFVSNRILCPMINEAILALQERVAEPEAIDGIMKLGMNHPIGPLALADLIGLDTVLHIMRVLHDGFDDDKYAPAELLVQMVDEGKLGRKSGRGFYDY